MKELVPESGEHALVDCLPLRRRKTEGVEHEVEGAVEGVVREETARGKGQKMVSSLRWHINSQVSVGFCLMTCDQEISAARSMGVRGASRGGQGRGTRSRFPQSWREPPERAIWTSTATRLRRRGRERDNTSKRHLAMIIDCSDAHRKAKLEGGADQGQASSSLQLTCRR